MNSKTVTVQLVFDENDLYFRDLGEMLSRHVTELCSKGNFGHEFAAGIYRVLADQLERAEFDESTQDGLMDLAREGFDAAMYGPSELASAPKNEISRIATSLADFNNGVSSVRSAYFACIEYRKLRAILDKYVTYSSGYNGNPIRVLLDDITPRVEDLRKAQVLLQEIADSKGQSIMRSKVIWKRSATIDEIAQDEEQIIFYEDILADWSWNTFIDECLRYAVLEATEEEVSQFAVAYGQLPDGFQISSFQLPKPLWEWTQGIRSKLDEELKAGMFINDISEFNDHYGLSEMDIDIRDRVELLQSAGIVNRGKQKGKVFFSLFGCN